MKTKGMKSQEGMFAYEASLAFAQDSQPKDESIKYGFKKRIKMFSITKKCLTCALFSFLFLALCRPAHGIAGAPGTLCFDNDTPNHSADLYYLGQDGNLWAYQSGAPVQVTGLANQGPAPHSTGIACYVNTIYNGNEVFYLTNVGGKFHIEQLYGSTFYPTDLTVAASAIPVASGSPLVGYIDSVAKTDNVFFIGTDNFVHVLTWSAGKAWQEDTALDNKSRPAASTLSGLSGHIRNATNSSQEIFYVGTNAHVYELWRWSSIDAWNWTDVTKASGSNAVAESGSPLASGYDTVGNTDMVFYLSANQDVDALLFSTSGTWSGIDLTADTGGAKAASNSALNATMQQQDGGTHSVYFEGTNQIVRSFYGVSQWPDTWIVGHIDSFQTYVKGTPQAIEPAYGNGEDYAYVFGPNSSGTCDLYFVNSAGDTDITAYWGGTAPLCP